MIRRIKKRTKHRVTIVDMGSDFGIGPKFVAFMRNKPRRKRYEPAPIKRKSQRGPGAEFARYLRTGVLRAPKGQRVWLGANLGFDRD